MKKLFSNTQSQIHLDWAILILRICIAGFMLTHGISKFEKLFGDQPIKFHDPLGIGTYASLALTVFSELVCSMLIAIGLLTRLALIPLIITMLVAAFKMHLPDGFGEMEFALLYLLIYLILFVTGGGKYSLDRLILNRMN